MGQVKQIVEDILVIVNDIASTAADVNKNSVLRKDITEKGIELINMLSKENVTMIDYFNKVKNNIETSLTTVNNNNNQVIRNANLLSGITENLNYIKLDLNTIENEIVKLTRIVDEIKSDTDDIFTLALNASIVSSKYSNTSGVFDILANKLNEMSNFISQNLEDIVFVVRPITEGIQKLIKENEIVLTDINSSNKNFLKLPQTLNKQKSSMDNLYKRGIESGPKISNLEKKLKEIDDMMHKMDNDAQEAIAGSLTVRNFAENLAEEVEVNIVTEANGENEELTSEIYAKIDVVIEKSKNINQTALNVNEKSRNQLKFTENCIQFTENILDVSKDLKETAHDFNTQSESNNSVVDQISTTLTGLNSQLKLIENKILESNKTIQTFNEDYKKIDNIIEFLKNILKSMHLIGMYSRIESARDIEQYEGFMNISGNINKLQTEIQNNIPLIEKNISDTHALIDAVNMAFQKISSDFFAITESSTNIIKQLKSTITVSTDTQEVSLVILDVSTEITTNLNNLRMYLAKLTEVVKNPIEGSAANIERAKKVENFCNELKKITV